MRTIRRTLQRGRVLGSSGRGNNPIRGHRKPSRGHLIHLRVTIRLNRRSRPIPPMRKFIGGRRHTAVSTPIPISTGQRRPRVPVLVL
jgi:hypothetical protein